MSDNDLEFLRDFTSRIADPYGKLDEGRAALLLPVLERLIDPKLRAAEKIDRMKVEILADVIRKLQLQLDASTSSLDSGLKNSEARIERAPESDELPI